MWGLVIEEHPGWLVGKAFPIGEIDWDIVSERGTDEWIPLSKIKRFWGSDIKKLIEATHDQT